MHSHVVTDFSSFALEKTAEYSPVHNQTVFESATSCHDTQHLSALTNGDFPTPHRNGYWIQKSTPYSSPEGKIFYNFSAAHHEANEEKTKQNNNESWRIKHEKLPTVLAIAEVNPNLNFMQGQHSYKMAASHDIKSEPLGSDSSTTFAENGLYANTLVSPTLASQTFARMSPQKIDVAVQMPPEATVTCHGTSQQQPPCIDPMVYLTTTKPHHVSPSSLSPSPKVNFSSYTPLQPQHYEYNYDPTINSDPTVTLQEKNYPGIVWIVTRNFAFASHILRVFAANNNIQGVPKVLGTFEAPISP